jgi:hypothetical protein
MGIQMVFGPLYIAALIYALSALKKGRRPRYSDAMAAGLQSWVRLAIAQLLTGALIGVGFVLLLVPGIVLFVRYALLDPVVVLEGAGTDRARHRSTELTAGRRWQILWAWLLFYTLFLVISYVVYVPLEQFPVLNTMATGVALDCALDVAFAIIHIVMVLYYWDAVQKDFAETDAAVGKPTAAAQPA